MECPKCKTEVHNSAKYCGCGWKKQSASTAQRDEPVRCAHEECGITAMCKIKTPIGWANLCWQHYDEYFAKQAHHNLSKWGLEKLPGEKTSDHVMRMRKFVREGAKKFVERTR
tara:strand:+ start:1212 stop:1550 length:339 start_codon:yes stop_codon:yes gene_type:complete